MIKAYTMERYHEDFYHNEEEFKNEIKQLFSSHDHDQHDHQQHQHQHQHHIDTAIHDAIIAKKQQLHSIDSYLIQLQSIEQECMGEHVILDVHDPLYDTASATSILSKCKLLVLRNALSQDYVTDTLEPRMYAYLQGIQRTTISQSGRTTNGEHYYYSGREAKRWEVLLTEGMIQETKEELILNPLFTDILTHDTIFGSQYSLMSAGCNYAAPGAVGQRWHEDESYIFEDSSFRATGVAGHDLPAYAITMSIPLLDITSSHGPTEFCMGSSTLNGLGIWKEINRDNTNHNDEYATTQWLIDEGYVINPELVKQGSAFERFTRYGHDACHPDFWLSPVLQKGDVLFFDYQLKHRGGWNSMEDESRAIMYLTFRRYWFRDSNFWASRQDYEDDAKALELFMMTRGTRFAKPDDYNEDEYLELYQEEEQGKINDLTELEMIMDHEWDSFEEEINTPATFLVTNKNIKRPSSSASPIHLYRNEMDLGILQPGQTMTEVTATNGDTLFLRVDDQTIATWQVHHHHHHHERQQQQVVFHTDMH